MSRFKRYERYKDSGVEWIGEIPEEWDVLKLKWIFKLVYRYPTYYGIQYSDNGVIEVRGEMLKGNGLIDVESCEPRFISEEISNNYPMTKLKKDDIVMSVRGTMGKIGLVTDNIENANITANLLRLSPNKNKVYSKWLVWLMESSRFNEELDNYSDQTTIKTIRVPNLLSINIPLPKYDEQNAIANFLYQKTAEIDGLIADKEKLIELLQEKRQAIITEAVTKGLNPNVRMKDSGIEWIGEIPAHWRLSKIKYESLINNKTLSESTDDDYEIDYIDISSVTSIGEIDGVQSLNFKDAPSRARRILYKGDTIVSTVRTYLKAIAFIENAQSNLICSTGFAVLTPLSKVVPKYLFYLMRSEKYVNEIVRRSVGVSYPAVNTSDIGALECALPDRDEQMYIVEYLDNCTTQINQLLNDIQAQIQKLKEYRQSLISEAVTGKIDVRDYKDEGMSNLNLIKKVERRVSRMKNETIYLDRDMNQRFEKEFEAAKKDWEKDKQEYEKQKRDNDKKQF